MLIMANHEYHVIEMNLITNDVIKWLNNNLDSKKWFMRGNKVYFESQKDHMMFLLRWS